MLRKLLTTIFEASLKKKTKKQNKSEIPATTAEQLH